MKKYLEETEIIDFKNKEIFSLAIELANDCKNDEEIAKCFNEINLFMKIK